MTLVARTSKAKELPDDPKLFESEVSRFGTQLGDERLMKLPKALFGFGNHLDQHLSPVIEVPVSQHIAGSFEAIEHEGDRSARQTGGLREAAGSHRAVQRQQVKATEIGPIHAQVITDGLIEAVERILVTTELLSDFAGQFVAGTWRFSPVHAI